MTFDDLKNFTKCSSIIKEYKSPNSWYICSLKGSKYSLLAESAFFVDFDMVQPERRYSPAGTDNLPDL